MNERDRISTIVKSLTASYEKHGGINHIEGPNLPSQKAIIDIISTIRHILFPGFYEETPVHFNNLEYVTGEKIFWIHESLSREIKKSLCYLCDHYEEECCTVEECEKKAGDITGEFLDSLPALRGELRGDVEAMLDGDPAATSKDEVILAYPGMAAITVYRVANFLFKKTVPLIPRIMTEHIHHQTGIDIHPGARIGKNLFIDHGTGVVIGETSVIGDNVKIYQGVTLGALSVAKSQSKKKRHPTIEDEVTIYAGAKILGGNTVIGRGSVIGGNVWLVKSVPAYSKVYNQSPDLIIQNQAKYSPEFSI